MPYNDWQNAVVSARTRKRNIRIFAGLDRLGTPDRLPPAQGQRQNKEGFLARRDRLHE